MRKFNHLKALKVAFNLLYVVSFLALLAFGIANAVDDGVIAQEDFYGQEDCENCDERD
tara:strand:+ start:461 stop:634 length:174 start_codon:yes stop_codon:yes gene_type:complete